MRGEAEGADHGDESGDCGGATTEEFGRGRWKPAESTEEIEKGKENEKEKSETVFTRYEFEKELNCLKDFLKGEQ